jgi:hypothetical protein
LQSAELDALTKKLGEPTRNPAKDGYCGCRLAWLVTGNSSVKRRETRREGRGSAPGHKRGHRPLPSPRPSQVAFGQRQDKRVRAASPYSLYCGHHAPYPGRVPKAGRDRVVLTRRPTSRALVAGGRLIRPVSGLVAQSHRYRHVCRSQTYSITSSARAGTICPSQISLRRSH